MRIVYFVHDLRDAAVAKRIRMLTEGGADVVVLGFSRGDQMISEVEGAPAIHLGRTENGRLGKRAAAVARNLLRAPFWGQRLAGADVVIARNLEMLVLGAFARRLHAPRARLAFECLDIHRIMLKPSPAGRFLRALEHRLLGVCDVLIVSSSAFLRKYFEPYQRLSTLPVQPLVVENKTFPFPRAARSAAIAGPPWRIAWFGMIRCRRSLDMLTDLARRRPDLVRIDIRGRPSYTEFDDFDARASQLPNLVFGGPYRPEDLPALYGASHFNWAIDYFEDEGNSRWLLPNRLYEGGCFGIPAIARRISETGHWLNERGLGVLVDDPAKDLERFLDDLTPETYGLLSARHAAAPMDQFVLGPGDSQALMDRLAGAAPDQSGSGCGRNRDGSIPRKSWNSRRPESKARTAP